MFLPATTHRTHLKYGNMQWPMICRCFSVGKHQAASVRLWHHYTVQRFNGHNEHISRTTHLNDCISACLGLEGSKMLSFILFSLFARVCSREVSHVFSFETRAVNFKGSRKLYLVKMNCHVCLTDAYNEISVGMFQRGNAGNKRRANPITLLRLNLFFPCFLRNFAFLFIAELSYSPHPLILSSSIKTGTSLKKTSMRLV